jgi:hypothetical protein
MDYPFAVAAAAIQSSKSHDRISTCSLLAAGVADQAMLLCGDAQNALDYPPRFCFREGIHQNVVDA